MPVFKAFFAIAKKRRNAALIYLGVYAVITLLLSALSQDSINENFKASQRSIAITDEDNTDASRALCDYLASIHQVTTPEPGEDTALLDAIYYRTLNYAMVIPEGFEDRVLAGETKDLVSSLTIPGSSSSQYVDNQITQYVQALQLYLAGGDTIAEAIDHTDHTISDLPKVSVTSFQMSDADTNSMVFYFFQYLPYIFLAILFAGMAPILVTLNSLAFLLFTTALSLLISTFSPDDNVLNMLANIVGLSMSFLCGVFVPQSMLSGSVLAVGRFLPAYWYIRANNMLAGFGKEVFDLGFYWKCIGIQLLFAAAMFALTAVAAKQRRSTAT